MSIRNALQKITEELAKIGEQIDAARLSQNEGRDARIFELEAKARLLCRRKEELEKKEDELFENDNE